MLELPEDYGQRSKPDRANIPLVFKNRLWFLWDKDRLFEFIYEDANNLYGYKKL